MPNPTPHVRHPFLSQKEPWSSNKNNIWVASTLNMFRNLAKFKFPGKLDITQRKQVLGLLEKGLLENSHLDKPSFIHAEAMDPSEKEFLYEHFLSIQGFHHAHTGEGFVVDKTGEFLAVLNIRDHIQLQLIDCNCELEKAWDRLVRVETALGKSLDYAFSSRFGFLTGDPFLCGTGLVVHIFLHLPALIHTEQLHDVLQAHPDETVATCGIQGDATELLGDILTLYNNFTIGLTEEDIISHLHTAATRLIVAEKSARAKLKTENNPFMRDKVSRAFGLLTHSYRLEPKEAWDAISLCKLGFDLDWIKGCTLGTFNELFSNNRRAHLLQRLGHEVNQDEVPQKRAEYIHGILKEAYLTTHSSK